jgi:hypothetical protein
VADLGRWCEVGVGDDLAPVLGPPDVQAVIAGLDANRLPLGWNRVALRLVERLDVLDRHLPTADKPTLHSRLENPLYCIVDNWWPQYEGDGRLKPGARLSPTAILESPLPP